MAMTNIKQPGVWRLINISFKRQGCIFVVLILFFSLVSLFSLFFASSSSSSLLTSFDVTRHRQISSLMTKNCYNISIIGISSLQKCRQMLSGSTASQWKDNSSSLTDGISVPVGTYDIVDFVTSLDCHVTQEEQQFPLGFSILTYENMEQTLRLLRLIYRSHNVYCLHVDAKSPEDMHRKAEYLTFHLKNIVLAKPAINVTWGEFSVLEAEIMCIRRLLESSQDWKYFINLVGRDFPLRTNLELVRIFKVYNGFNDIAGSRKHDTENWYKYQWKSGKKTSQPKAEPPHSFVIYKGSAHIAATRKFMEFVVHDKRAKDLLNWMKDIHIPDEHFFQTLNHNSQFNIPGAVSGTKPSFVRLKRWQSRSSNVCAGQWVRQICNIGAGDLPWVIESKHMFLNKLRMEDNPHVYDCLELWYTDRTVRPGKDMVSPNGASRFNIAHYVKLAKLNY